MRNYDTNSSRRWQTDRSENVMQWKGNRPDSIAQGNDMFIADRIAAQGLNVNPVQDIAPFSWFTVPPLSISFNATASFEQDVTIYGAKVYADANDTTKVFDIDYRSINNGLIICPSFGAISANVSSFSPYGGTSGQFGISLAAFSSTGQEIEFDNDSDIWQFSSGIESDMSVINISLEVATPQSWEVQPPAIPPITLKPAAFALKMYMGNSVLPDETQTAVCSINNVGLKIIIYRNETT